MFSFFLIWEVEFNTFVTSNRCKWTFLQEVPWVLHNNTAKIPFPNKYHNMITNLSSPLSSVLWVGSGSNQDSKIFKKSSWTFENPSFTILAKFPWPDWIFKLRKLNLSPCFYLHWYYSKLVKSMEIYLSNCYRCPLQNRLKICEWQVSNLDAV